MKLGVRLCFLTVSPIEIEGLCSINVDGLDSQLEVTCKVGDDEFKKHFLGISADFARRNPGRLGPGGAARLPANLRRSFLIGDVVLDY